jgi:hypothetical protein
MANYELVDCCPVPAKLAPVLRALKADSGCVFQSVYRGVDARALLNKCGKHDQAWLYAHLPPGVANPPGRSTHELRSDGVAYRGPIGRHLAYWQVGMDIDDPHVASFINAARKHRWVAWRPYAAGVEYHHVNFAKEPIFFWTLKPGSRGPLVFIMTRRLAYVERPGGKGRYLHGTSLKFNKTVEVALKQFQKDHQMTPDGQYGPATAKQLASSVRYWKLRRKNHK